MLINPCTVLSDIQLSSGTDIFTPTSFGTTGNVVTFSDLPAGNYRVQEMRDVHLIKEWGTVTITGNGDTQAPQLNCVGTEVGVGNDFNLALGDTLTLTIDDIITDVSDNCGIAELALYRDDDSDPVNTPPSLVDQIVFTNKDVGTWTGTVYAVDIHGQRTQCNYSLYVEDIPYFPNGCNATLRLGPEGTVSLTVEDLPAGFDYVTPASGLQYTYDTQQYTCNDLGLNTRVVTVIDEVGNQSSCTATIRVVDRLDPVVDCRDVTYTIDENNPNPTINYLDFIRSATDNCLTEAELLAGYSWDTNVLPLTLDCSHVGVYDITLPAVPVAHETLPRCRARLFVRETIEPIITCRDTTFHISNETSSVFTRETLPINSVSDNCVDSSQLIYTWMAHDNFRCEDVGTTVFWVQVNDGNGNSDRCYFNVNILEPTGENVVFPCRSQTIYLSAGNNYSRTIQPSRFSAGVRTEICQVDVPGTLSFAEGQETYFDCSNYLESPHPVNLIYTPDDGSPAATCSTTVRVVRDGFPSITCPSGTIELEATYEDCGAIYTYDITATDPGCPELGVDISLINGLPSGSTFPVGTTPMLLEATNVNGTAVSCNFAVTVTAPSEAPTLTCPEDYTVTIADNACSTTIDTSAIFQESCYLSNTQFRGPAMGTELEPDTYNFGFRTTNTRTNASSQCTFQVTIAGGNTSPTAICKDTTVTLAANNVTLTADYIDGGSFGRCSPIVTRFIIPNRFNCSDFGTQTVDLLVRDENFVSSTCEASLTLIPADPICQDVTVSVTESGIASIVPEDVLANGMCNSRTTLSLDQSEFDCTQLGTQLVTLTRTLGGYSKSCTATVTVTDASDICPSNDLLVDVKAILAGPYDPGSGLMSDHLRALGLIPTSSPYANAPASVSPTVFSVSGSDAIVDWVVVELHSAAD
ncbi:MAG: hypothetical protein AAGA31_15255, partial [Bacteroidota bacterium]